MRGAAVVVVCGIACGAPFRPAALPDIEPANLIDGETYTTRIAGLRATLARSNVEIDTQALIETCASGEDRCVRCEVAGRRDTSGVDPEMIDGVALAFARYPTSVLAAAKLAHVALCRTIRSKGGPHEQPAGVAILHDQRLLISIEHFIGKPHNIYDYFTIEQVVHHELFHLFDHATLGEAVDADREWEMLNPPGFAYRDPAPERDERPAGFVNHYATTNAREDRASVFEYLMGQPKRLCEIAEADPIVAAKTAVVWNRIVDVMGEERMHRYAPCIGWIEQRAGKQAKLPKQYGPRPVDPYAADKPVLGPPRPKSLLGKMR